LKVEALDSTVYRDHFGRGYGPSVRQTAICMRGQHGHHCGVLIEFTFLYFVIYEIKG